MDRAVEPIEFEFQLTREDYFRALLRLNLRRFWFLLLVPLCGFTDIFFKATDPNRSLQLVDLGAVISMCLFYGFILFGAPYLSARSMMKSQNFMAPIKYRFAEGGIEIIASCSTAHHDWSIVDKVQETERYIMLFAPKNCLQLIPKAVIGDRMDDLKQKHFRPNQAFNQTSSGNLDSPRTGIHAYLETGRLSPGSVRRLNHRFGHMDNVFKCYRNA